MATTTWLPERVAHHHPPQSLLGPCFAATLGALLAVSLLSACGLVTSPSSTTQPEESIARVYRQAIPGVVQVVDRSRLGEGPQRAFIGSGFVLDRDGHILTNRHVVQGVRDPGIVLCDGGIFQADVVGADQSHDLAVLKVSAPRDRLHPLAFGDSSRLEVGRSVVAIGSPFGLENSLTSGVISYVGRPFAVDKESPEISTVQTDASINPGNSGGPLLDLSGRVVGVNVAAYGKQVDRFEWGSVGVGFAIPSNDARSLVQEMIDGRLTAKPWLGLIIREIGSSTASPGVTAVQEGVGRGAMVAHVLLGGPADEAGLRGARFEDRAGEMVMTRPGDVIVAVDGTTVRSPDDLASYLARSGKRVGETVTLRVAREGEILEVSVRLRSDVANVVEAL